MIDAEVKSGVAGAKIRLLGTSLEAVCGPDGQFAIHDVPVGTYSMEFSCPFHASQVKTDVVVKSARTTVVEAELSLDPGAADAREVTVSAEYFTTDGAQPVSSTGFAYEEIRRAAGAAGDVSRIISGLPSVARTNDMVNSLVVRGGSPAENAFYVDGMEVPNINHYPVLGSTGGAIGLLNVDFIRRVTFSAGGFSPLFGDRLSSVLEVDFREGSREKLEGQLELSMMGLGVVAEGPLGRGRGAWMLSGRRSYVDLLIGLMRQGVPVTWSDVQAKLACDLSSRHRLSFLGLLGVDDSGTKKEDATKDGESFYGQLDTVEYTAGLNWLAMWGASGYSSTSVFLNSSRYASDAYETVTERLSRRGENAEWAWSLRNVNVFRVSESSRLQFGLELRAGRGDFNTSLAPSTDILGQPTAGVSRDARLSALKSAVFAQHSWDPWHWLTLNLGLRVQHFSLTGEAHVSPRASLSLGISKRTSLDLAAGVFRQSLPLVLLQQQERFRSLRDPAAYHLVVGLRHLLTPDTRLSIEAYDKEYDHFPLDPAQPGLFVFDELFYSGFVGEHETLLDTGRARAYGLEVMVQKKLARKFYGLVSAAYFRTRYRDLAGRWRDRVYDNQYIIAAEGGWRISPTWEFSAKWNLAGGASFTPFDIEASRAAGAGIFDAARINAERLPAYHSLNLRADKRFHFRSSNLILYLSVWNILDHENVMAHTWNTNEQAPGKTLGWGILPVLGVEFEF